MTTEIRTHHVLGLFLLALCFWSLPSLSADSVSNITPQLPPETVEMEEIWRIGGDDDDILFGLLVDVQTDDDGNIYLLDNQLCHVEVFSPNGEHLRTLSREGEGPGEVRRPMNLVMLPDKTIGILELFPGKYVRLTLVGEPRSTLEIGGGDGPQTGFTALAGSKCRGGTLLLAGQHSTPNEVGQDRTQYLCSLDLNGKEITRFKETHTILNFQKAHFVERELLPGFFFANAIGPDGRVYVAPDRNSYKIEVYQPDGILERTIEREYISWKRDARDMRRWNTLFDTWASQMPFETTRDIESHEPAIAGMHVMDDGTLWVQHSRSGREQPNGVLLTYDIFDSGGNFLQQVSIACEGDPVFDGLEFLSDGRVLLIKGLVLARLSSLDVQGISFGEEEETGSMEVVCYQMKH